MIVYASSPRQKLYPPNHGQIQTTGLLPNALIGNQKGRNFIGALFMHVVSGIGHFNHDFTLQAVT